ncbi:unnamed protein product [Closterium sp. Naga37s-1]|nr:unnamed protein product [Closterium sp. Naga37s-1]
MSASDEESRYCNLKADAQVGAWNASADPAGPSPSLAKAASWLMRKDSPPVNVTPPGLLPASPSRSSDGQPSAQSVDLEMDGGGPAAEQPVGRSSAVWLPLPSPRVQEEFAGLAAQETRRQSSGVVARKQQRSESRNVPWSFHQLLQADAAGEERVEAAEQRKQIPRRKSLETRRVSREARARQQDKEVRAAARDHSLERVARHRSANVDRNRSIQLGSTREARTRWPQRRSAAERRADDKAAASSDSSSDSECESRIEGARRGQEGRERNGREATNDNPVRAMREGGKATDFRHDGLGDAVGEEWGTRDEGVEVEGPEDAGRDIGILVMGHPVLPHDVPARVDAEHWESQAAGEKAAGVREGEGGIEGQVENEGAALRLAGLLTDDMLQCSFMDPGKRALGLAHDDDHDEAAHNRRVRASANDHLHESTHRTSEAALSQHRLFPPRSDASPASAPALHNSLLSATDAPRGGLVFGVPVSAPLLASSASLSAFAPTANSSATFGAPAVTRLPLSVLQHGSLVCLLAGSSRLAAVRYQGRWELGTPTPSSVDDGSNALAASPADPLRRSAHAASLAVCASLTGGLGRWPLDCLFVLLVVAPARIALRSLAADGRCLSAALLPGERDSFRTWSVGDAETWEVLPAGAVGEGAAAAGEEGDGSAESAGGWSWGREGVVEGGVLLRSCASPARVLDVALFGLLAKTLSAWRHMEAAAAAAPLLHHQASGERVRAGESGWDRVRVRGADPIGRFPRTSRSVFRDSVVLCVDRVLPYGDVCSCVAVSYRLSPGVTMCCRAVQVRQLHHRAGEEEAARREAEGAMAERRQRWEEESARMRAEADEQRDTIEQLNDQGHCAALCSALRCFTATCPAAALGVVRFSPLALAALPFSLSTTLALLFYASTRRPPSAVNSLGADLERAVALLEAARPALKGARGGPQREAEWAEVDSMGKATCAEGTGGSAVSEARGGDGGAPADADDEGEDAREAGWADVSGGSGSFTSANPHGPPSRAPPTRAPPAPAPPTVALRGHGASHGAPREGQQDSRGGGNSAARSPATSGISAVARALSASSASPSDSETDCGSGASPGRRRPPYVIAEQPQLRAHYRPASGGGNKFWQAARSAGGRGGAETRNKSDAASVRAEGKGGSHGAQGASAVESGVLLRRTFSPMRGRRSLSSSRADAGASRGVGDGGGASRGVGDAGGARSALQHVMGRAAGALGARGTRGEESAEEGRRGARHPARAREEREGAQVGAGGGGEEAVGVGLRGEGEARTQHGEGGERMGGGGEGAIRGMAQRAQRGGPEAWVAEHQRVVVLEEVAAGGELARCEAEEARGTSAASGGSEPSGTSGASGMSGMSGVDEEWEEQCTEQGWVLRPVSRAGAGAGPGLNSQARSYGVCCTADDDVADDVEDEVDSEQVRQSQQQARMGGSAGEGNGESSGGSGSDTGTGSGRGGTAAVARPAAGAGASGGMVCSGAAARAAHTGLQGGPGAAAAAAAPAGARATGAAGASSGCARGSTGGAGAQAQGAEGGRAGEGAGEEPPSALKQRVAALRSRVSALRATSSSLLAPAPATAAAAAGAGAGGGRGAGGITAGVAQGGEQRGVSARVGEGQGAEARRGGLAGIQEGGSERSGSDNSSMWGSGSAGYSAAIPTSLTHAAAAAARGFVSATHRQFGAGSRADGRQAGWQDGGSEGRGVRQGGRGVEEGSGGGGGERWAGVLRERSGNVPEGPPRELKKTAKAPAAAPAAAAAGSGGPRPGLVPVDPGERHLQSLLPMRVLVRERASQHGGEAAGAQQSSGEGSMWHVGMEQRGAVGREMRVAGRTLSSTSASSDSHALPVLLHSPRHPYSSSSPRSASGGSSPALGLLTRFLSPSRRSPSHPSHHQHPQQNPQQQQHTVTQSGAAVPQAAAAAGVRRSSQGRQGSSGRASSPSRRLWAVGRSTERRTEERYGGRGQNGAWGRGAAEQAQEDSMSSTGGESCMWQC